MEQSTAVILQGVDERVAAWLPVIHQVQADYFAQHGRYAQSLLMASVHPSDGQNTVFDRPDYHPTDQQESPADLFVGLPQLLRANIQIDVYSVRGEYGYAVVCYHMITSGPDEGLWTKSMNFGPGLLFDKPWSKTESE